MQRGEITTVCKFIWQEGGRAESWIVIGLILEEFTVCRQNVIDYGIALVASGVVPVDDMCSATLSP